MADRQRETVDRTHMPCDHEERGDRRAYGKIHVGLLPCELSHDKQMVVARCSLSRETFAKYYILVGFALLPTMGTAVAQNGVEVLQRRCLKLHA